eukprot:6179910-Pleurochrysis_carterae.AAC.8
MTSQETGVLSCGADHVPCRGKHPVCQLRVWPCPGSYCLQRARTLKLGSSGASARYCSRTTRAASKRNVSSVVAPQSTESAQ